MTNTPKPAADTLTVTGLEEHFVTDDVLRAWQSAEPRWQDLSLAPSTQGESGRRLAELGDDRIAAMDEAGVDRQVLSLSTPGVQSLPAAEAVSLAATTNDLLAETIAGRSDRFGGFATLPTPDPAAAAAELGRAVTELRLDGAMIFGRTRDRTMDAPEFWPIYEAAADLRAPLHLHPQSPSPRVREAYYSGFTPQLNAALSTHGIGWHYETGVELLRLILAGVFDHFPDLQVIVGHWGEIVLFYLDRISTLDNIASLERPIADYLHTNVYIAPSGVYSHRYLRWAADLVGTDRLLFSTDYPFVPAPAGLARRFLAESPLPSAERAAIASGNWERLRQAIRRPKPFDPTAGQENTGQENTEQENSQKETQQ